MEQRFKSTQNIYNQSSSRISKSFNHYNINDTISQNIKNNKKIQSVITSSMQKNYYLNKIQLAKFQYNKIDQIKLKCFQTSKDHSKTILKQFNKGKSTQQDSINTTSDAEQQTDDTFIEKRGNPQILLKHSKFNHRPPTIFFQYPSVCGISNQGINDKFFPLERKQLKYKINGWQYKCIINSLQYNGFTASQSANDWNIYFDIKGNKTKKIENIKKWQKISHFPGCWYIGRKDFLWRGIHKIKRMHPQQYNFVPFTYLLPNDFERFETARQIAQKSKLWIMKPAAAACGRGIKMIGKDTKVQNKKQYLISQYVDNPHLINNLKYDLRVYVLVTSYDPLLIYIFEEGLVRFATHQYNCSQRNIKTRFIHLTNFSVNKHSKKFIRNTDADADNQGSKWSFKALKKHYQKIGIDTTKLFMKIQDVIIKTCISAEPNMLDIHSKSQEKRNCCFQLYGFDILVDANLKPWLMEVNVCPSLSSSSPMDAKIKHILLTDLLNLIGIPYSSMKDQEKARKVLKDNFFNLQIPLKKIFSRNINTLQILNYENCLELLSPEDWLILFESEEQLDRIGHFKRIFPVKENISQYQHLFEFRRYYNILLWKSLLSPKNFLDKIVNS